MSAHTPGPWLVTDRTVYALTPNGHQNRFWAGAYSIGRGDEGEASRDELAANVSLIAAAPDLLSAAEAMCTHIEDIHNAGAREFAADAVATARYEALHAAIAKARGGR